MRFALCSLLFLLAAGLAACRQSEQLRPGDPKTGEAIFRTNCAACHSTTGETKFGPSLKGLFNNPLPHSGKPGTAANVEAQITNGSRNMPAFGQRLRPQQIADVAAYLKTL